MKQQHPLMVTTKLLKRIKEEVSSALNSDKAHTIDKIKRIFFLEKKVGLGTLLLSRRIFMQMRGVLIQCLGFLACFLHL